MMSDLPRHVYAVKDRHGKVRYRFVRKGYASAYFKAAPGTADFHREYAEIIDRAPRSVAIQSPRKVIPGSLDDLFARVRRTPKWHEKADSTKRAQGNIMDRFADRVSAKGHRYGDRPVTRVTVSWLENIFGAMHDTPQAANVLRKVLSRAMRHAQKLEWIASNPVPLTEAYPDGEGHADWSDEDIAKFRAKHRLGTTARLTLELALNTAARRCNVNKIERDHIRDGRIFVDHVKGNNDTSVPMLATTREALEALPAAPIRYLVVTEFGKPFTDAGLGNRMRKWCDAAGLHGRSLHGLRKSCSRLLAETRASDAEGQAVTGHKKDGTFAKYRARANRRTLADHAFSNLSELAIFQPSEKGDNPDA